MRSFLRTGFTAPRRHYLELAGVLTLGVAFFDQLTKIFVLRLHATAQLPKQLTEWFNLVLVWNHGISFGMLSSHGGWMPLLVKVMAIGLMLLLLNWLWNATSLWQASAIGLVLGGALGNVLDRLHFGAVVDFLDVHWQQWHWPAFNLADSAICIGVVILVAESIVAPRLRARTAA